MYTINAPVLREDAEATREPAHPATGRGETILYVDDEASIRQMSAVVLRRLGYTPLTAADGLDALVVVAERKDELRAVVTDLAMPRLAGPAFIRELRRTNPDLPVIAVSGEVEPSVEAELRALGVVVILQKPFNQARLADAVIRALGATPGSGEETGVAP